MKGILDAASTCVSASEMNEGASEDQILSHAGELYASFGFKSDAHKLFTSAYNLSKTFRDKISTASNDLYTIITAPDLKEKERYRKLKEFLARLSHYKVSVEEELGGLEIEGIPIQHFADGCRSLQGVGAAHAQKVRYAL